MYAWLDAMWIGDPPSKIASCVLRRARPDARSRHEVSEVRGIVALSNKAWGTDRMAKIAGCRTENLLTAHLLGSLWLLRRLPLGPKPRFKLRPGLGKDSDAHE